MDTVYSNLYQFVWNYQFLLHLRPDNLTITFEKPNGQYGKCLSKLKCAKSRSLMKEGLDIKGSGWRQTDEQTEVFQLQNKLVY